MYKKTLLGKTNQKGSDFLITKDDFNLVRTLVEEEEQLIYKFKSFENQLDEPQIKEEFQKIVASLNNQKTSLLDTLEVGQ